MIITVYSDDPKGARAKLLARVLLACGHSPKHRATGASRPDEWENHHGAVVVPAPAFATREAELTAMFEARGRPTSTITSLAVDDEGAVVFFSKDLQAELEAVTGPDPVLGAAVAALAVPPALVAAPVAAAPQPVEAPSEPAAEPPPATKKRAR